MKGVQCYELFGGIALKNHAFFIIEEQRFGVKSPAVSLYCVHQQANLSSFLPVY